MADSEMRILDSLDEGEEWQGSFLITVQLSLVAASPWRPCTTPGGTRLCEWCPLKLQCPTYTAIHGGPYVS